MATRVATEGYLHVFDITTDYGPLEAEGIGMLLVRLHEVTALAQLDEISKSEVLLKSAGTSVLNLGKGVASVVKDPESTVKGIGGSVKRFGGNLGRKAKGAVDTDGAPVRRRDGLLDVRNQLRSAELDAESGCRPVGHHEPRRRPRSRGFSEVLLMGTRLAFVFWPSMALSLATAEAQE